MAWAWGSASFPRPISHVVSVHGHGGFWYSANTLPFRKLEHLIDFKPLILTNTPGKLRSSEIKYLG